MSPDGQLAALGHTVVVISGSYSHLFTRQPSTTGTYSVESVGGLTYRWVQGAANRRAISVRRVLNMLVFMARLYRLPVRRLPRRTRSSSRRRRSSRSCLLSVGRGAARPGSSSRFVMSGRSRSRNWVGCLNAIRLSR